MQCTWYQWSRCCSKVKLRWYSIKQLKRMWLGRNYIRRQNGGEKYGCKKKKYSAIYVYPRLFKYTCLKGHFKPLKIENHSAYCPSSPSPRPPETVSQTAMVIGSERFSTGTFNWTLNLWGKHLCWPLRKASVCLGAVPVVTSGLSRLQLPRRHQRWNVDTSAIQPTARHGTARETEEESVVFWEMWCEVFGDGWCTTLCTQDTFPKPLWFLNLGMA